MKKIFAFLFLLSMILFAKSDFSEMSTQELLAMMGYVPVEKQKVLYDELKIRQEKMTPKERQVYEENLKKLKK